MTRSFTGFTQAEKEIGDARIWAGVHTRTADDHGGIVGRKVADLVLERALQPMGRHARQRAMTRAGRVPCRLIPAPLAGPVRARWCQVPSSDR